MVLQSMLRPTPIPLPNVPAGDHKSLLARTAAGDSAALAELFHIHAEMVQRVAWRVTRSADDADDILQDVFIGLPESLRRYRDDGHFEAWLARVATRTALMRMRRDRRQISLSAGLFPARMHAGAGADIEARLSLERALEDLPPAARDVFLRREVEGQTHEQIASELGISRNASEVRLFRALRQLRSFLRNSR